MPTSYAPKAAEGAGAKVRSSHDDFDAGDGMCDGLKFESEQRGDLVIQPPSPFPEVWNATLQALELGSATGFMKGAIIPQKAPHNADAHPSEGR
jgi:hypothetical protein